MDTSTIPPMKPVLVENITDDINALNSLSDVGMQKTLMTARALSQMFDARIFNPNNPNDKKYFVNNRLNLDLVTEGQVRVIDTGKFSIEPDSFPFSDRYEDKNGQIASDYAVDYSLAGGYMPSGFLYVFSCLENDTLLWPNYDGKISIPSDKDKTAVREGNQHWALMQIFIPNNEPNYLKADGTKDPSDKEYRETKISEYNTIKIRRATKIGDNRYSWGKWKPLSEVHHGPKYFTSIIVDEKTTEVTLPLSDAVYHIYGNVNNFALPNANLVNYKLGQKIIIEVHPPRTTGGTVPSCRITYTDTLSRGEDAGLEEMSVLVTPRSRINNKDVFGNVKDEHLVTSVAAFELVETKDKNGNVYRTWELDAGIEESDFTSGLAQMLGEHTDMPVDDIVLAQNESVDGLTSIDVVYPVTSSGYVKASFLKTEAMTGDSSWFATVQVIEPDSDGMFDKVTGGTPDPSVIYFVRQNEVWRLAENNGHPASFDVSQEYYSLNLDAAVANDVIPAVGDTSILSVDNRVMLADLQVDKIRRFVAYAHRGSVIKVHIESNKTMTNYRGKVYPEVGFLPDPHSSYILKTAINPFAFTSTQLSKLFIDGSIVGDIKLATCDELYQGILNAPVASRALIEAYAYLATKLQRKGLLFGNRYLSNATGAMIDGAVEPGRYYVKLPSSPAASTSYPPYLNVASGEWFNLIVIGNDHAPIGMIHDEDGLAVGATKLIQIAVVLSSGNPTAISSRIGTKSGSTWSWTAWSQINDWSNIVNTPMYFKSRWDMFDSPNNVISMLNGYTSCSSDTTNEKFNVKYTIDKTAISGFLSAVSNPQNKTEINYEVPTIVVGATGDAGGILPGLYASQNVNNYQEQYIIEIRLPDAKKITLVDKTAKDDNTYKTHNSINDRRRSVKIQFYGDPSTITRTADERAGKWHDVKLHVFYCDEGTTLSKDANGQYQYDYVRNWGGQDNGYIEIEFEQFDTPDGKRIWCPVEVG